MMSISHTVRPISAYFTKTFGNLYGYEFLLVLIYENVAPGISFRTVIANKVLCRLILNYKPNYAANMQNVPKTMSP